MNSWLCRSYSDLATKVYQIAFSW